MRGGVKVSEDVKNELRDRLSEEFERQDLRQVRETIAAMRLLGEPQLVEMMIEELAYGNVYERKIAAWALGDIAHPASTPVLVEALRDDEIREFARQALLRIGNAAAAEVVTILDPDNDERWETRDIAVQILKVIGDEKVIPDLVDSLWDSEHAVRWSAATALATMGEVAIDELLDSVNDPESLDDDDGDTCLAAASALVWMNHERGLQGLLEALNASEPMRRALIAQALGDSSNDMVVAGLVKLLDDTAIPDFMETEDDSTVGEIAAESLERIGTPDALEALQEWRDKQ